MHDEAPQGGDNTLPRDYFRHAVDILTPGSSLLNFGCGSAFIFEALAQDRGCRSIVSVDLNSPTTIPPYVDFRKLDVETVIDFETRFDFVTFFEVIEHVDKTDVLLRNCFDALIPGGYLAFSFPNLASIYSRLELLFGLQPHILEVSNERGSLGSGYPGRRNNPSGTSIHHVRGITHRAMRELIVFHGFSITRTYGLSFRKSSIVEFFPSLAPQNMFICRKEGATSPASSTIGKAANHPEPLRG